MSDHNCGTCKHGTLHDQCGKCEDEHERGRELAEVSRLNDRISIEKADKELYFRSCAELEADLAEWKAACKAKTEIMSGHSAERQCLQQQVTALQSRLHEVSLAYQMNEAKLAALEKQGPVGYVDGLFDEDVIADHGYDRSAQVWLSPPLYTNAPPAVPDNVVKDAEIAELKGLLRECEPSVKHVNWKFGGDYIAALCERIKEATK